MKHSSSKRSISPFAKYYNESSDIKERMLQNSFAIKTQLNKFKDEVFLQRKTNGELARENRDLSSIADRLISDSNLFINKPELHKKINESFIVIELKKEIKALLLEIKNKQEIIEEYKKNIKITHKQEWSLENEILINEMSKIKKLYLQAKTEVDYYKSKSIEVIKLKNEFVKQNYIILSLNEKNNLYLKEIKAKNDTIEQMNKKINDKNVWYKNAKIKLNYQQKLNTELIRNSSFSNGIKGGETNSKYRLVNSNIPNKNKSFLLIKRHFKANRNNINNSHNNNINGDSCSKLNIRTEHSGIKRKMNDSHSRNKKWNENGRNNLNQSYQGKRSKETMNELSEKDFKEISYILMKSIEGRELATDQIETMFNTKEIKQSIAQHNTRELSRLIWKKLCNILTIKEHQDPNDIYSFVKCFIRKSYGNKLESLSSVDQLIKEFIDFFYSIASDKSLSEQEELCLSLKDFLIKNQQVLVKEFKSIDVSNTGLISFKDLKNILQETKIELSGELLEYIIYQMKKSTICSLHQLDYSILAKQFIEPEPEPEDNYKYDFIDIDNGNQESKQEQEQEEGGGGDLKMTEEEYNTKTKEMISRIVKEIITKKTTITNILLERNSNDNNQTNPCQELRIEKTLQLIQSKLGITLTQMEVIVFYNKYAHPSESSYKEGLETLNATLLFQDINSSVISSNQFLQGISTYLHNKGLQYHNFFSLISVSEIIKCECVESSIKNSFINESSIQTLLTKCQIKIDTEHDRLPILFTDNKINLDYLCFIFTCLPQMIFISYKDSHVTASESSFNMEDDADSINQLEEVANNYE